VAFGGKDLGDLYVTSARTGPPGTQKREAGCLFVVRNLLSHADGSKVHGFPANDVNPNAVKAFRK